MSTTLTVKDVIFTGGQRATAGRPVDVSMETLASVWAGALRASELHHAGDLSDVQYEYDYSPQPSRTPSISPHLQKNKQLQDTLQQREEEVIRLQQENNTLRRFLNSAFIPNLQEKTRKLPLDTRRKLKRSLLQSGDNRTSQNLKTTTTPPSLRKRVCRNLLPELCAVASGLPPPPPSEEPDPLDLWVLRTLGLKDQDTIDTSLLPPPSDYRRDTMSMSPPHHPASDYRRDRMSMSPPHHPASDYRRDTMSMSPPHLPASDYRRDRMSMSPPHHPASDYRRDTMSMSPPHHPAALSCPSQYRVICSSDDTEATSPHSAVLSSSSSSSCEYGLEAISYLRSSHHVSPSSSIYPLHSPFASSNPPPLVRESSDRCRAPGCTPPPAFDLRAAVNPPTASPSETDITTSLNGNCLRDNATALNAPVQERLAPLDGCPNFTAVASADRYGVNVSVTDNYHPAGSCRPALSQRDGEIQSTGRRLLLTPPPSGKAQLPPTAFLSDQVRSRERNPPGGYFIANQSSLLHRSQSQQRNVPFTRHLLSPVLSSSPPLPHNEDLQPTEEFSSSPPQTLTTSAAVSSRAADHLFYRSPRLQRANGSPSQESVPLMRSPQTRHCPSSQNVTSKRPLERFSSNDHCHPPTSPPGGATIVSTWNLPRQRGTDVAFSMSLSPSCSVKTHSFPQGQAFVKKDTQGQWRFTWVPKQGP